MHRRDYKRSSSSERSRTRHKHQHKSKDSKRHRDEKERGSLTRQRETYRYESRHDDYKRKGIQEGIGEGGLRKEGDQWGQGKKKEEIVKELPCWEPSGILVQFYNSREGVSLKFHQPPESRRPIDIWRIYIFKGDDVFEPILLNNSCYLLGKDNRICDILCENESISRQHAVIQFRLIVRHNEDGSFSEEVKPYLMDLESTNGTYLNGERIESSRYIQLLERDIIKFGFSEREYVMVKEEGRLRGNNDEE